ncbi:MAG: GerMN domain-containing protein [bacterium]|nr:GerMN domain-containing protein [bacterium]
MNNTNNSTTKVLISIAALVVIVLLVGIIVWGVKDRQGLLDPNETPGAQVWQTYTNEKYGVTFQYPDTWQVSVDEQIPGIHVFKKGTTKPTYLTHHNVFTHVSLYPKGIGTEGVYGQTKPSTVSFKASAKQPVDYILKDGTRWGTMVSFNSTPASWESFGFVWAGTEVQNHTVQCIQNGKVIREDVCEIGVEFETAETVHSGTINVQDRNTQEQILASIQFTANTSTQPTPEAPAGEAVTRVKIFMVEMAEAEPFTGPTIGCGDRLIPVNRDVKGQAVLKAALEDLFSIKTAFYGESGFYNSLSASKVKVDSASIDANGKATVKLSGTLMSAGTCDDPRIQEQIKATVMQFSTVKSADITINGKTLAAYFDMR